MVFIYITLQTTKRNLGLFGFELIDLLIIGVFSLIFIILFLLQYYTIAICVIGITIVSLLPLDFSKTKRGYKLLILFVKYVLKPKDYYLSNILKIKGGD